MTRFIHPILPAILWGDEYNERFEKGAVQKQLSKEFVREWLMENGFQGKEGQQMPEMTADFIAQVSARYIELFELVTGQKFVPASPDNPAARIEKKCVTVFEYRPITDGFRQ